MEETKILIVFYSMTGNVAKLAEAVRKGAEEENVEIRVRQVRELIPEEKWNDRMKEVKENLKDIPLATNDDLVWADGIAFGTPTRYGNVSAQLKDFIDSTGGLWQEGKLIDKVATMFTSTASQHGGSETTILTGIVPLFHHGMIVIGVPYSEQRLFEMDEISGGSPYGASSISGANADVGPKENELEIAKAQGRRLARVTKKFLRK